MTGVKTNLQVLKLALRDCSPEATVTDALSDADDSVQRMQRTREQLLLLARLDGPDAVGDDTCDPGAAATRRVSHSAMGLSFNSARRKLAGVVPNSLLKTALRYCTVPKPDLSATSAMGISPFCRSSRAASSRCLRSS